MDASSDELLALFDAGAQGRADVDMRAVLWDILDDVRRSYRLALREAGVMPPIAHSVDQTVEDYLINHYGDD